MEANTLGVGISIGSESAVLAITPSLRDEARKAGVSIKPSIIAAEGGERTTPAYVAYVSGELVVGAPAKSAYVRSPLQTLRCLLPITAGTRDFVTQTTAEVDFNANGDAIVPSMDDSEESAPHNVSELLAALLNHMLVLANDAAGGRQVSNVVLTIPRFADPTTIQSALDSQTQIQHIGQAFRLAYEDTCILLANGIGAPGWKPSVAAESALVIDWGCTTVQVSLFDVSAGSPSFVASEYATDFGGQVVDKALAQLMVANFKRKTRMDPGEGGRPFRKLISAAERVKIALSASQSSNAEVEAFFEGRDLMDTISRGKLDQIVGELQLGAKLENLIKKVLGSANPHTPPVRQVILAGGMLKSPSLNSVVRAKVLPSLFGDAPLNVISSEIAGDEAAASGASIHGALYSASELQLRRHALAYDIGLLSAEGPLPVEGSADSFVSLVGCGAPLPFFIELDVGASEGERTLQLLARLPPSGGNVHTYRAIGAALTIPPSVTTLLLEGRINGGLALYSQADPTTPLLVQESG